MRVMPVEKAMGYDLHITKAEDWVDSSVSPISQEAWYELVESDPELVVSDDSYYDRSGKGGSLERIYATQWVASSDEVVFWFQDGEVVAKNPDDDTIIKMLDMAEGLGARVQGDDGEIYHRKNTAPGWAVSNP